jgi:hypothetical protein
MTPHATHPSARGPDGLIQFQPDEERRGGDEEAGYADSLSSRARRCAGREAVRPAPLKGGEPGSVLAHPQIRAHHFQRHHRAIIQHRLGPALAQPLPRRYSRQGLVTPAQDGAHEARSIVLLLRRVATLLSSVAVMDLALSRKTCTWGYWLKCKLSGKAGWPVNCCAVPTEPPNPATTLCAACADCKRNIPMARWPRYLHDVATRFWHDDVRAPFGPTISND